MSVVQRGEFLDTIEAGLAGPLPVEGAVKSGRKARILGGAVLASAAMAGLFGGVASAAESVSAAPTVAASDCSTPDPVAHDESKWCGTANFYFKYLYNYLPNGVVRCYVFDETIYNAPCGGTVGLGNKEACA